jgi:hypothetical protein
MTVLAKAGSNLLDWTAINIKLALYKALITSVMTYALCRTQA